MALADRIATWTTGVVIGTSLIVGGTALALAETRPPGVIAATFGAVLVAIGVGNAGVRFDAVPALRRFEELARDIRKLATGGDPSRRLSTIDDREAAELARSVNALLDAYADPAPATSLLDACPFGIIVVGGDGRLRYLNERARTYLDVREEPVGRTPLEAIPVLEVAEVIDAVRAGRDPGRVACASGELDLSVHAVPSGPEVLVSIGDITPFRKAEQTRTTFVANVSHELRTPVSAILGYAETLLADRDELDSDTVSLVETIYRNGRRLRDLFDDLLVLHRIESRRRELPLGRARLRPVLEVALVDAAESALRRKQELSLDCPEDLEALFHPEALQTIVGNLASNASKYSPEGGRIRVHAHPSEDGEGVDIDVHDDGIGIEAEHHDRIFERFYRVDVGRSRRAGGTGLGLAIVKHLALASRSRVSLTSEVGKGSCFSVHLGAG